MHVFCIFTVCVCISSLLVSCSVLLVTCSVPLPVEHYYDCQGVSGQSTMCDCSVLVDGFFSMFTI